MKPLIDDIRSLEEKHLIAIMLYLNINPRCKKIEIYENVSSNPRIPDKLNRLESMGLITQQDDSESRSIIIALTDKGADVAEKLAELDRIIRC